MAPLGWVWLALVVMTVAPKWPGVFTVDSQAMYRSGLENEVSDWYAPLHAAAWGFTGKVWLPVWIVTVAGVGLFVLAVIAVLRLNLTSRQTAAATVVVVLWPPVYGLLSWVGRDVWFASWLLLAIWATMRAARSERPWRYLAGAAAFALLAADARQNGIPLILFVMAVAIVLARHRPPRRLMKSTVAVACCLFAWLVLQAAQSVVVQHDHHPEQYLYLHDLAELTIRTDQTLLPEDVFPSQDRDDLAKLSGPTLLGDAVRLGILLPHPYSDEHLCLDRGLLRWCTVDSLSDRTNRDLRDRWIDAIRSEPIKYLDARAGMYARQLGLSGLEDNPFYGRSDELDWDRSPQLRQRWPGMNDLHTDALLWLSESRYIAWIYAPVLYLLAGLGAAAALIVVRRDRTCWILVFGLQLALQTTLFVSTPVVRFRYQYFQVVLGIVLTIMAVHQLRQHKWSRYCDGDPRTPGEPISPT